MKETRQGLALETERLVLYPLAAEDAPELQKHIAYWDILKFFSRLPWPFGDKEAMNYVQVRIDGYAKGEIYSWGIRLKENNELIGAINFFSKGGGLWERSYWVSIQFQRKGYITEASIKATDYMFNTVGIQNIKAETFMSNKASIRVKEKTAGTLQEVEEIINNRSGCKLLGHWLISRHQWQEFRKGS